MAFFIYFLLLVFAVSLSTESMDSTERSKLESIKEQAIKMRFSEWMLSILTLLIEKIIQIIIVICCVSVTRLSCFFRFIVQC